MIEILIPKAYSRYRDLPIMGKIIEAFTNFLMASGYTRSTVKLKIRDCKRIEQWLTSKKITSVHDLNLSLIDQWWNEIHKQNINLAGTIQQLKKFLVANQIIRPPILPQPTSPIEKLLVKYQEYLTHQKGFSASTIYAHDHYTSRFLAYCQKSQSFLDTTHIKLQQIYEFIQDCSVTTNRFSLQHIVAYLRSFLRYLFKENLLLEPLYQQIESPRTYRLENLPRVLSRQIVLDLLTSVNRSTPEGCRDYAILYLAAHYGLRASEIVTLKLENVQWKQRVLLIQQTKTSHVLYLPLTEEAIEAIGRYIQTGRPNHLGYREVFLRNRAPSGTLKPTAVSEVFQYWSKKSGLPIPFQGSHCLRHSLANYLLEQGQSAKMIGDLFGHLNLESTSVYLRVQYHQLRKMVLPIPSLSDNRARELLVLRSNSHENLEDSILRLLDQANSDLKKKRASKKEKRYPTYQDFQSIFQKEFRNYLLLHRSLGKKYSGEVGILRKFDHFLVSHEYHPTTTNRPFQSLIDLLWSWLATLTSNAMITRRRHFLIIRKFLLYASQFHPEIKVPDFNLFPKVKARFIPYQFTNEQVALLLFLSHFLPSMPRSSTRASAVHLGILLLYVTGMRRGELLNLCWQDYDPTQQTLTIRDSKFHKSRILPVSELVAQEIQLHQKNVEKAGFTIQSENPIIADFYGKVENVINRNKTGQIKEYSGTGFSRNWKILCQAAGIMTNQGKLPRLHDLRHSFALNNLDRFYEEGRNPNAELPLLSAYMGHVSIVSTQYYLSQMRQPLLVANDWFLSYVQAESSSSHPNKSSSREKGKENWIEGINVPSFSFERKRAL